MVINPHNEWNGEVLTNAGRLAFRRLVRGGDRPDPGFPLDYPDRKNRLVALKKRLRSERLLCRQRSWAYCPLRHAAILSHISVLLQSLGQQAQTRPVPGTPTRRPARGYTPGASKTDSIVRKA